MVANPPWWKGVLARYYWRQIKTDLMWKRALCEVDFGAFKMTEPIRYHRWRLRPPIFIFVGLIKPIVSPNGDIGWIPLAAVADLQCKKGKIHKVFFDVAKELPDDADQWFIDNRYVYEL